MFDILPRIFRKRPESIDVKDLPHLYLGRNDVFIVEGIDECVVRDAYNAAMQFYTSGFPAGQYGEAASTHVNFFRGLSKKDTLCISDRIDNSRHSEAFFENATSFDTTMMKCHDMMLNALGKSFKMFYCFRYMNGTEERVRPHYDGINVLALAPRGEPLDVMFHDKWISPSLEDHQALIFGEGVMHRVISPDPSIDRYSMIFHDIL